MKPLKVCPEFLFVAPVFWLKKLVSKFIDNVFGHPTTRRHRFESFGMFGDTSDGALFAARHPVKTGAIAYCPPRRVGGIIIGGFLEDLEFCFQGFEETFRFAISIIRESNVLRAAKSDSGALSPAKSVQRLRAS
ncbi:MAG: hypothetical protein FMNOHCHN_03151 [Ignavibacteriaceae bacterium]|nr:hypothetical protein [Ignavibacteriaceae bacterium]